MKAAQAVAALLRSLGLSFRLTDARPPAHAVTMWTLGRRPGLDGLRGVAILLVVACHVIDAGSPSRAAPMGSAGVTVFFTLSGFLITSLLVEEHAKSGRVRLFGFYQRRARRLLPALVAFLIVGGGVFTATGNAHLGQALVPVFYISNWWLVAGKPLGLYAHTWSLAVEEQFYLVWPWVLILTVRRRRGVEVVCVVGIVLSVAARFALWDHGGGAARVFFGSDTHADALLIGALLAVTTHRRGLPKCPAPLPALGVAIMLATCVLTGSTATDLIIPTVVPWLTAMAIVGACSGLRLLCDPIVGYFGRRSYALYLWHYPLVLLADRAFASSRAALIAVVVAILLSEVSWWVIELPFLHRDTSRNLRAARFEVAPNVKIPPEFAPDSS